MKAERSRLLFSLSGDLLDPSPVTGSPSECSLCCSRLWSKHTAAFLDKIAVLSSEAEAFSYAMSWSFGAGLLWHRMQYSSCHLRPARQTYLSPTKMELGEISCFFHLKCLPQHLFLCATKAYMEMQPRSGVQVCTHLLGVNTDVPRRLFILNDEVVLPRLRLHGSLRQQQILPIFSKERSASNRFGPTSEQLLPTGAFLMTFTYSASRKIFCCFQFHEELVPVALL